MEDVLTFAQTTAHMDSEAEDDIGCPFLNAVQYTQVLEELCLNKYLCARMEDRYRNVLGVCEQDHGGGRSGLCVVALVTIEGELGCTVILKITLPQSSQVISQRQIDLCGRGL